MVRVLDRALLRSSERIHGDPFEQILDRFAMALRKAGCEHPGYCAVNGDNVELTGAARLYRAASSDRRERG
jgi:hypothetical protein